MLDVGLLWSIESYWKDLPRLLSAIPSRLRSIKCHVLPMGSAPNMVAVDTPESPSTSKELQEESPPIEADGLELLDAVLQGDSFQDLERVGFVLSVTSTTTVSERVDLQKRVLEGLQRKVPFAASRGILAVRSIVDESGN
ncbi:hypothetical protein C8T65DRAFT_720087 [Cerioporus squamosus]|nr:hypothetical protein C8T65DRAFT_720087 [Cerioporus squamosus]